MISEALQSVADGIYLWEYNSQHGMPIEVYKGKARVPTEMRECPIGEVVGGGMTLTPVVVMTPARTEMLITLLALAEVEHQSYMGTGIHAQQLAAIDEAKAVLRSMGVEA
jgi:hypothetical protein